MNRSFEIIAIVLLISLTTACAGKNAVDNESQNIVKTQSDATGGESKSGNTDSDEMFQEYEGYKFVLNKKFDSSEFGKGEYLDEGDYRVFIVDRDFDNKSTGLDAVFDNTEDSFSQMAGFIGKRTVNSSDKIKNQYGYELLYVKGNTQKDGYDPLDFTAYYYVTEEGYALYWVGFMDGTHDAQINATLQCIADNFKKAE